MFEGFKLARVSVGDVELRVRSGGSGPAVVLLHGPFSHSRDMESGGADLGAVIHGRMPRPARLRRIDDQAR
jgi:hypothetical protein